MSSIKLIKNELLDILNWLDRLESSGSYRDSHIEYVSEVVLKMISFKFDRLVSDELDSIMLSDLVDFF